MIKKLFVSYSDDDRDVACKIRKNLLDVHYDVWIDKEGTPGKVMWTQAVLDAIDEADGAVLVWSPEAAKSLAVNVEIQIARVFRKPIFPILAHRLDRIPALPDEFQNLQVINEGDLEKSIVELVTRLRDSERNTIEYVERANNGYISKPRNPYFVGRNSELKKLFVDTLGFQGRSKLGIPIAISGLAGIGKTHLALAFAYRCNVFFSDGVFWVDTPNGIVQEFEKIGNYLKIRKLKEERPSAYATRVKEELEKKSNGLVIFDNVTDIDEFRHWCLKGNNSCSVIFTTRNSPRGFAVRVINLKELDADSAFKLIVSRRSNSDTIAATRLQREAFQRICDLENQSEFWTVCRFAGQFMRLRERAKSELLKVLYVLKRAARELARVHRLGDLVYYWEYEELLNLSPNNREKARLLALQRRTYFDACRQHKVRNVLSSIDDTPFEREKLDVSQDFGKNYQAIKGQTVFYGQAEGRCLTAQSNEEYLKKLAA